MFPLNYSGRVPNCNLAPLLTTLRGERVLPVRRYQCIAVFHGAVTKFAALRCGMLAVALDVDATFLSAPRVAGQVLAELGRAVPARRRNKRFVIEQPAELASDTLSHPSLDSLRKNEGAMAFATLGSGNHFIELQADDEDRLWITGNTDAYP